MKKININGNQFSFQDQAAGREIWTLIEKELEEKGHSLYQAYCDGVELSGDLQEAVMAGDYGEMEIRSTSPRALVIEGLMDARVNLPQLKNLLTDSAAMLQQGKETEGTRMFTEAIEGLEWLSVLIEGVLIHCPAEAASLHNGESIESRVIEINEKLSELLAAWENRDYILISDLIEYELVPLIETWEDKMEMILNKTGEG